MHQCSNYLKEFTTHSSLIHLKESILLHAQKCYTFESIWLYEGKEGNGEFSIYSVFNEDEIQNYFSLTNLFEENHVSLFEHDFNFYLITMINHSC